MNIEINIYSIYEIMRNGKKTSFNFMNYIELTYYLNAIKEFNKNLNKRNLTFSNGMCYEYKYPVLLGNCSRIGRVIKTLTHEINHHIIYEIMKESGLDIEIYDFDEMERINRIMSRQSERVYKRLDSIMRYLGW